jgi:hypothetical protein
MMTAMTRKRLAGSDGEGEKSKGGAIAIMKGELLWADYWGF